MQACLHASSAGYKVAPLPKFILRTCIMDVCGPCNHIFTWLTYNQGTKLCFAQNEFALTLEKAQRGRDCSLSWKCPLTFWPVLSHRSMYLFFKWNCVPLVIPSLQSSVVIKWLGSPEAADRIQREIMSFLSLVIFFAFGLQVVFEHECGFGISYYQVQHGPYETTMIDVRRVYLAAQLFLDIRKSCPLSSHVFIQHVSCRWKIIISLLLENINFLTA